jgi:hypothetical protein
LSFSVLSQEGSASAAKQSAEKLRFDFVLKGRGFKPRRKCHKLNPALAAEAPPRTAKPLFQQTVKPQLQHSILRHV